MNFFCGSLILGDQQWVKIHRDTLLQSYNDTVHRFQIDSGNGNVSFPNNTTGFNLAPVCVLVHAILANSWFLTTLYLAIVLTTLLHALNIDLQLYY